MSAATPDPRSAPLHAEDALHERRVAGEQVYAGKLLDVRRDRAQLPDGGEAVREYIVHPGAVLVVPVRDDGRLIVERQFRYPHNRIFLEFPAGKLDPGETPLATGVRELAEEAGYRAAIWTRLGVIHPVISYSTETIELYAARGLVHVGARLDPGEFLEIVECTEDELYAAIDEGLLTDAKTIAALVLLTRWARAPRRSVRLRIEGVVQGVGYRDWVLRTASAARIAGWVRNRRDGSVEAQVQGDRAAVDRFADGCARGPRAARVERIEITRSAFDAALSGFELLPSA
ncbi:MAG TPA: acylphosphatase [Casimicrobiaceae bacterium]